VLFALGPWASAASRSQLSIDEAKVAAAGIRKLPPSKRLILYTDLPSSPEVDALPGVFDQAFPQWCEYFHVSPTDHANWRMTGFLMKDRDRFTKAGLLPEHMPPFRHGFSEGHYLWLYDKPSDYYRRHLLLHEGTHGFMSNMLGAVGPPWYAEGTAEMMGTHRLHDGRLTLNYMPANREEVPEWGRVRLIKDAVAQRRAMRLQAVLDYSSTAHLEVDPYAWSWAIAVLLDRHPHYRDRFRELYKHVGDSDFNERFHQAFAADWRELNDDWAVFVSGIEYGYDVERTVIDYAAGRALPSTGAVVSVAADHGWQNSGLRLEAGKTYQLVASGRYQVGTNPTPWWCEPGGVSIRYYQGRPLGLLLAAVRPDSPSKGTASLLKPLVVGLGTTIAPEQSGTLFFKINHSAAELRGNSGGLKVRVVVEGG
jgi:hypothetical protein